MTAHVSLVRSGSLGSNPLSRYLHDHLARASQAQALLEAMRIDSRGEGGDAPGDFAAGLLADVRVDCDALLELAAEAGVEAARVAELRDRLWARAETLRPAESPLALRTIESLDLIALDLHGRWVLWQVLESLALSDRRLQGIDFKKFAARAQAQEERVNALRRELSRRALEGCADS